jgi:hypothetical protein
MKAKRKVSQCGRTYCKSLEKSDIGDRGKD